MQIKALLNPWLDTVESLPDCELTNLSVNSQTIEAGGLFIAINHGIDYIPHAIEQGAVAILVDASVNCNATVPLIKIPHLQQVYGDIASRFYGDPSSKLTIIGVTGTNGKTSVTYYLAQLISTLLGKCGVIGTLGVGKVAALQHIGLTTPDSITVHKTLKQFVDEGFDYVAMEVSSHALAQHRVQGVQFDQAVFTNLSHDHLDYHGTMENYAAEKFKLFSDYAIKQAVINYDDSVGQQFINRLDNVITFSCANGAAEVYAKQIQYTMQGMSAQLVSPWGEATIQLPLLGAFNLSNVLACIAVLGSCDVALDEIVKQLKTLQAVPGRMQCFAVKHKPLVIVDYAHTPDALQKALQAVKQHCSANIWCVFGCGGDRDRAKRAEMAIAAETLAQYVVVTSDNPRTEDPQQIIDDICQGFTQIKPRVEADRTLAIAYAIKHACENDVILVAGKGHEDYQIIGIKKVNFSDISTVKKLLAN